ncbi:unnamed protein product [Chilo suppressalis]|uniref:Shavenoid isoform B-like N-terminal domain-containing protein n=1 Tax=Chilo suppressalis TaxID=168631 RepID=A0ABN8AY45_CHISP|nr:unnamed protein product [Chilo suppressalis]
MHAARDSMAAALLLLLATATGSRLGDLARRDTGDVFTLLGKECGPAQCAEHGAGETSEAVDGCACACPQRAPLFREDRELCVDDLPECSLASFGTGSGLQRIPFVYLPLKGQIIHPSKEITFPDVKTPICAVSGAQFLTRKGFLDLRNTLDADVPFNLFRDEGRTFLQWSGEDDVRTRMSGRVMVVRLLCRDVSAAPTSPLDLRGVFTPCVAFRVQGTPPRQSSNVTEVQFASNAQTLEASNTSGLSVTEYVAIGLSSLLLGLIYVASVFLYLHIRKRRKAGSDEDSSSTKRIKGLKKKDGSIITERDIVRVTNERVQPLTNVIGQDDGLVKKNPLLNMTRQYHESKSFPVSDSGSNVSDSEDFAESSARSDDTNSYNNHTTSAVVHLHRSELKLQDGTELSHRDESGIERLPDEHVSIVETTDDREIARPVGTTRRKLYFNPAYFEPQLMAEPPPAALEFLVKIREVISIAKHKMAAKRFHPVLNEIPEEETYPSTPNSIDIYQGLGSQRSGSIVSLKRENNRKKSVACVGCPGCKSDNDKDVLNYMKFNMKACSNCQHHKGDKQSSIRQWLENIPIGKHQPFNGEFLQNPDYIKENRNKLRKQNSFTASNCMYSREHLPRCKKSSNMSVRSEPPLRGYNLPLPEFENANCVHSNYTNFHCQTVSRVDDITPIGLSEYRSGILRNSINNQHRIMPNQNGLPDMVNDTITLDHHAISYNQSSSDEERYNRSAEHPNVYTRNNSASISGNEYETDSLERNCSQKRLSTPTEFPEIPSSQASPSLSNALPLEEELTMRNAVYKTHSSSNSNTPSPQKDIIIDENYYETIGKQYSVIKKETSDTINTKTDYSLVSEVYVNNNYNFGSTPTSPSGSECSFGSRKLITNGNNTEEKPGCLTIEVKDSPENYIKIHESDGFEPDTLDRKQPKHKETIEQVQFSRKDFIKSIDSDESQPNQKIQLRSSGTFTKTNNKVEYTAKFNSLRNEYEQRKNCCDRPKLMSSTFQESKNTQIASEITWENDPAEWNSEEGRILTLELRHSKRQRQSTPPTIKQLKSLARPDILPPLPPTEDNPIYEQPIVPPRKVEIDKMPISSHPKNLNGRSLSPRTLHQSSVIESTMCNNPIFCESKFAPTCGPLRASGLSQSSEYDNDESVRQSFRSGDFCRNYNRKPARSNVNSNTFIKGTKDESHGKSRFRRKKGANIEDSGYLSSDSTSSRQVQRRLVIPKIVSCSESDDTENEARSESGAESIETHSVYFGSFRNGQVNVDSCCVSACVDTKSVRNSIRKIKHSNNNEFL